MASNWRGRMYFHSGCESGRVANFVGAADISSSYHMKRSRIWDAGLCLGAARNYPPLCTRVMAGKRGVLVRSKSRAIARRDRALTTAAAGHAEARLRIRSRNGMEQVEVLYGVFVPP